MMMHDCIAQCRQNRMSCCKKSRFFWEQRLFWGRTDRVATMTLAATTIIGFEVLRRLAGSESLRQHNEVVSKYSTVHIRLEMIEPLPVAA